MVQSMNQHRYTTSFPAQDSTNEFFDSSTWISYGIWLAIMVSFIAHGIMYYHPDTGFAYNTDLKIIAINAVGVAVLFVLKLFAQNCYVVGLFMAILCFITSVSLFTLMFYITYTEHFPIAYVGGILYFCVAGYLLNKDYNNLI